MWGNFKKQSRSQTWTLIKAIEIEEWHEFKWAKAGYDFRGWGKKEAVHWKCIGSNNSGLK